ncbi:signal transduction histidine kinase [Psychromicrobium silvestre]|uniref:Signal transduction histidine kinase n=1 Tax=Psychromicrobium silvestre TaxID=1645614 RepID=A0A7Y9LUX6_9MICC|nr:DUF3180 domain-containing protein [Psychromicrobium silvestre]NYE96061.1 signal transduction histidine kinase [Psychromicrobium silvestre]
MRPSVGFIRARWLLVIALISTALGWIATVITNRLSLPTPALPFTALITLGIVVLAVLLLGFRVRSWRNGNRERALNPILAARTLVLAQASAYAGALLLGWHLGVLIDALAATFYGASAALLGLPAALMGGSAVMIVVGLVVERFCRIPPEDGADSADGLPRGT